MSQINVGVGELYASRDPADIIATHALGTCVAVILLDAQSRCAGLAHIALPESAINPEDARTRPARYADTSLPALLEAMARVGSHAPPQHLTVKLAGGANILQDGNPKHIGWRNVTTLRELLARRGMRVQAEDVGDIISRTVKIGVAGGCVTLNTPGRPPWAL